MIDFSPYTFYHKTPIHLRFNDIDMLRHVNNSVYANFFDGGRFDYFREVINVDKFRDDQWIVLATITIDYILPLFLEDKLMLETKIIKIGKKSMDMIQQIKAFRNGEEQIVTKTSSVLVCYNLNEEITVTLPQEWRNSIKMFEKDINL